jgi:hypothetical protein
MSNMSYCRFENTLDDLWDCKRALDDGAFIDKEMDKDHERPSMIKLIKLCKRIADDYGEAADDE